MSVVNVSMYSTEFLTLVPPVLVKHSIESDGSLSGLTVTNDQLTLTTSNGNHGVDRLETSLYGLVDGTAGQDTGGLELGTAALSGLEGTLSIDGVTESINDTSEKSLANGNVDNLSGTLDGLAFLDQTIGTEKHNTDLAGFQVHAHALNTRGEPGAIVSSRGEIVMLWTWRTRQALRPEHCSCHGHGRYRHCSAVSFLAYLHGQNGLPDGENTSSLGEAGFLLDTADPLLKDGGNFRWGRLCVGSVEARGVGECGSASLLVEKAVSAASSEEGSFLGPAAVLRRPPTSINEAPLWSQWHRKSVLSMADDGWAG